MRLRSNLTSGRSAAVVAGALSFTTVAGNASGDAIDDLAPGTWYEIPNTHMRDVCPPDAPDYEYSFHCAAVLGAWGGAALDTTRGKLVLWGGGHGDYKGNEIYAFDFHALTWARIWGPTPDAQIPSGGTHEVYDDGNPGSRHTYSGLSYVPAPVDAFVSMGGSLWQSGSAGQGTWLFSFATMSWTRGVDNGSDGYGDPTVYDPVTGHLWRRTNREMTEYDPVADSYTDHFAEDGGFWRSNVSTALDPEARLMVIVGDGVLDEYRLDTDAFTANVPIAGPIPPGLLDAATGIAFDTMQKRFVLWNGGADIYTYDPATKMFEQHATMGATPPAVTTSGGTFGRFRYVPSRNVFGVVTSADENVFVFRMSKGQGEPLPGTGGAGGAGSGGASSSVSGAGGSTSGAGGSAAAPGESSGCGCRVVDRSTSNWWGIALLAACAGLRRRR
jgi:MYXO-CTERM domain-containing protein